MTTHLSKDTWHPVYIDGVKRLYTYDRGTMYLDSDLLPGRRCSAISLDKTTWQFLLKGQGSVRTSGVIISMLAPKEKQPVSAAKRPEPRRPSLATKIINVIKEHYK